MSLISAATLYIRVSVSFFLLLGLLRVLRNAIQGLGYTRHAMGSGVMEMIARVLVAVFAVPVFGFPAVCAGDATAWVAANRFLVPAFIVIYRKVSAIAVGYRSRA